MHRIKKGLDLPIAGEPQQSIHDGPALKTVGLVAEDYVGMKPTMAVQEGDVVELGQLLFEDKKTPGVRFTSPGAGRVVAVNRGEKRLFLSIVIELEGDGEVEFRSYRDADLTTLKREQVIESLLESGLWTSFRRRPFSKVPSPESTPRSIFVTAMDTSPLAADPAPIIQQSEPYFGYGLQVIRHLTDGPVFVCKAPGTVIPGSGIPSVRIEEFDGPHPAGLPGTHIHVLDPVSDRKSVWYVGYQDVIAIGRLFATGRLSVERIVSLAGPAVKQPQLLRTRLGANSNDLTANALVDGETRVISGSVLSGRRSQSPTDFLGRYHQQVSAIREEHDRVFLGWQSPGFDKFSVTRAFASAFVAASKRFPFTTSLEGSRRAMVPIGTYERVMPLDILPTQLLRSLIVGDTEQAQALGCLELDEEDLALCTYVCPGKYDYGPILRRNLRLIEREG